MGSEEPIFMVFTPKNHRYPRGLAVHLARPARSIVHFVNSVRLSRFHDETSLFHRRSPSGFAVHLIPPTRSIHGFQLNLCIRLRRTVESVIRGGFSGKP